ncbi:MAG TPA: chorismate synthase [Bdellovibrionota bacterium]|nr:chorismate synthase [Bdellovibrionota bacterium]
MASNQFGNVFAVTTFGESHGKGIGAVIDGCPANLEISVEEIQQELDRRRPGQSHLVSPRKEKDQVEILSGVFEGKTTGAPIALFIRNQDADSNPYESIKHLHRPGHANFSYLEKYGIFDYRGGGRASARETVARVAAGAIAKKLIAPIEVRAEVENREALEKEVERAMQEGDSIGAVICCEITNVMKGLGDPIYQKLEALLAFAMLSIPATRGFEFGAGFRAAEMKGSEHNAQFGREGILGGISSGAPIAFRVAFKPTSSIKKAQETTDLEGNAAMLQLPEGSRHDPCVALRAPVIVESMAALVLADALLMQRLSRYH